MKSHRISQIENLRPPLNFYFPRSTGSEPRRKPFRFGKAPPEKWDERARSETRPALSPVRKWPNAKVKISGQYGETVSVVMSNGGKFDAISSVGKFVGKLRRRRARIVLRMREAFRWVLLFFRDEYLSACGKLWLEVCLGFIKFYVSEIF